MKKILFSVALLLGGMAVVSAQSITPVGKFDEGLGIIPKTFTVDKQAKAVALSYEDSDGTDSNTITYSFTVFGKGFSVAREFSYNSNLLKGYTLVEQRALVITPDTSYTGEETEEVLYYLNKYDGNGNVDKSYQLTTDDCIAYINRFDQDIDSTYTDKNGRTYFIVEYYEDYRSDEIYKDYPTRYYYLEAGKLYMKSDNYNVSRTGDWISKERDNYYGYTEESSINEYVNYTNADSESPTNDFSTILTQTLFNDDDKYEFFVTKRKVEKGETHESDYDDDGTIDYKETSYSPQTTEIEIVSEDGSILSSIPTGGDHLDDLAIYTFNGENYLALYYYYNGNEYYYTQLYRIDKGSSSLQEVSMPAGMKMFPTLARPSDEITIEFEPSADNAVRTLSVSDVSGRTVEQCTVAPDASRITVSARRFHAGTYIFTLTENGKQVDNGKIIVK